MTIRTGVGFMRAINTAIRGNGLIFALALAGVGTQGCFTENAPVSPVTEDSSPAELDVAAQTASSSIKKSLTKNIGNGCTLHAIIADAGSRARANTWISCDDRHWQLSFIAQLTELPNGNSDFAFETCRDVYWCGSGNIYIPDRSGKKTYSFWVNYNVDGKDKEVKIEAKF